MAGKWSPAVKAEGIRLCMTEGMAAAHEATGVPKPTLSSWLTPDQRTEMAEQFKSQTTAAVAAHEQRAHAKRAEIHAKLLDRADRMLDRMTEVETDYRGNVAKQVTFSEASPMSCKAFATAAAILIDKYRLEMGEATSITEQAPERNPEHEDEMAKVMQLRNKAA